MGESKIAQILERDMVDLINYRLINRKGVMLKQNKLTGAGAWVDLGSKVWYKQLCSFLSIALIYQSVQIFRLGRSDRKSFFTVIMSKEHAIRTGDPMGS